MGRVENQRRAFRIVALAASIAIIAGAGIARSSGNRSAITNFTQWSHLHNDYAVPHVHGPNVAARQDAKMPRAVTAIEAATPRARCGPGSRPETGHQGRVPLADFKSGRADKPYTCNAELVARHGISGGFAVHRYVDNAGHECAIYDSSLLFGREIPRGAEPGTYVLDMSNPAKPKHAATLQTPAMMSPHESLRLNQKRGLLAANMGTATTYPGFVDVYDLSKDCRNPVLRSSTPLALAGHEGAFSPDGRTYWAATTAAPGVTAIDLTDPDLPRVAWRSQEYASHGLSISPDGKRAYLSEVADFVTTTSMGAGGFTILDVSEVQKRVTVPTVREVGSITWPEVSIPQNSVPVAIDGRSYAIQFDEYDSNVWSDDRSDTVGGVHVIDLENERRPRIVSRIRLEVHQQEARETDQWNDPGADSGGQGYAPHYCSVPRTVEPKILACSMILSGLRVFDIRDPKHPREIAYFNQPPPMSDYATLSGSYAMSAPAFVPERGEIWYSDSNSGFFNVRLTNAARRLLDDS
ncbi:MAG TPA: hypothetical protein VG929_04540 [Actinomycetota bacterium]|nr:hypothetical protein [Actinomycetota bacterium]